MDAATRDEFKEVWAAVEKRALTETMNRELDRKAEVAVVDRIEKRLDRLSWGAFTIGSGLLLTGAGLVANLVLGSP